MVEAGARPDRYDLGDHLKWDFGGAWEEGGGGFQAKIGWSEEDLDQGFHRLSRK